MLDNDEISVSVLRDTSLKIGILGGGANGHRDEACHPATMVKAVILEPYHIAKSLVLCATLRYYVSNVSLEK